MADRAGLFVRVSAVDVVLGAAVLWWLPLPAGPAWPWLLGSVAVHVCYILGLIAAYRLGDFNQTYPLARGVGPLVVAIVAVTAIGEPLPALPAIGVVLISAAVAVLGLTPWHRVRAHRPALVAAVLTGLTIAGYTLLDGVGVRRSGSAVSYTMWLMALHSLGTVVVLARPRRERAAGWAPWGMAVAAAVLSILAYGLVLWAQTRGALAAVAALRESSVVIAAGIGVVFFHEPAGRVRVIASVAVAVGVVLLALS